MVVQTGTVVRTAVRERVVAVAGATAAAVMVWLVASPLAGQDLTVEQQGKDPFEIGIAPVLVFSLAASLAGWGLLAVLERLTVRARTIWIVVAGVVFVLSFAPLLGVEAEGAAKLTLGLMHVAVGVVLIPLLARTARSARSE